MRPATPAHSAKNKSIFFSRVSEVLRDVKAFLQAQQASQEVIFLRIKAMALGEISNAKAYLQVALLAPPPL